MLSSEQSSKTVYISNFILLPWKNIPFSGVNFHWNATDSSTVYYCWLSWRYICICVLYMYCNLICLSFWPKHKNIISVVTFFSFWLDYITISCRCWCHEALSFYEGNVRRDIFQKNNSPNFFIFGKTMSKYWVTLLQIISCNVYTQDSQDTKPKVIPIFFCQV